MDKHEREHLIAIAAYLEAVRMLHDRTMQELAQTVITTPVNQEPFRLDKNPALAFRVNEILDRFANGLDSTVRTAIRREWDRSMRKNIEMGISKYGIEYFGLIERLLSENSTQAMEKFLARKTGRRRMNLLGRVWHIRNGLQRQVEEALFYGTVEGRTPTGLAQGLVQYLNNPDTTFQGVKNEKGLVLTRAARSYEPGQGTYHSALKAAERLVRHETNAALRRADQEKWKSAPYVLGFRTVLSAQHPRFDICDPMAELIFPVEFNWEGWHISCMCESQPVLASSDDFYDFADAEAVGEPYKFKGRVEEVPGLFKQYVANHRAQYSRWKSPPLFLQGNLRFVKDLTR